MKIQESIPQTDSSRPRGRPRIAGHDLTTRQVPVLEAAGRLLAMRPSGDITVEHLLQEIGTSRPSFYRWFPGGMDQVFDQLIAKANADLMVRIVSGVAQSDSPEARIRAGVRAYFDWGFEQGPVVTGIYREGFTEGSIAQQYRQKTIEVAIHLINQQAEQMGLLALPSPLIETLVSWIETAGVVVFRHYPVTRAEVDQQCNLTTRMFEATLQAVLADYMVLQR